MGLGVEEAAGRDFQLGDLAEVEIRAEAEVFLREVLPRASAAAAQSL